MLRLKSQSSSPPNGFQFVDLATGWRNHGWSFRGVWGAWYQENVRRATGRSKEACQEDVDLYVCTDLLKRDGWDHWVMVDDIYNPDDIRDLGSFENREESSVNQAGVKFVVVFPFCRHDGELAVKLVAWMEELGPYEHECLLSFDLGTPRAVVNSIEAAARRSFSRVDLFEYPTPGPNTWPPTIAFKAAAMRMQKLGKPWLWMEADAVPLKRGWLEKLQELYWNGGKSFAGPIVPDLGHMNGTGIYPANTPNRIPGALAQTRTAWDVTMKREMIKDALNLHPYFHHAWAMEMGELHPYYGGAIPSFPTQAMVDKINPEAVIFHRCKDGTLIDRLRERKLVIA